MVLKLQRELERVNTATITLKLRFGAQPNIKSSNMSVFEKYGTWAEIIYHMGCVISTAIVCHSQQENHVNEAINCQVMMGIFAEAINLSLLLEGPKPCPEPTVVC